MYGQQVERLATTVAQSSPSFTMTRSGAFKLSIVFFVTFILCLPEFFPKVSQIQFCCEPFDPCRPENDAKFCGQADPPCVTELINASSQQRRNEGWYLCKAKIDLRLLHNNPSESEDVMVLLTMKAGNLTGWNISVFAFLNNTELYTGPQNDQRLFYCYLPPDNSQCPDLNISTEEPTQQNTSHPRQNTSILKTTSSTKPIVSSLKTTTISSQVTASTHELKCQTTSSSFLFYYQEHNETARSSALPVTQTKKEGWCVITSVWLALVLTVVVVTLLSACCLIFKTKHRKSQLFTIVPISASGHQLSKPKEKLVSNVPDVSIGMYSMSDDDVFLEISSTENRTEENLLRLADLMYKKRLSPIFEITDENEDEEQCNAPETKEEFKKSDQLQHLAAQGNCEPSTYLHHRNNFTCSGQ
ncbi:uncharacterized protein si:dkey-192k22.2 isoform X2 [Pimephales promelas]|uniref:uncharacterized protein si:dkey-192k22.2 isoform X2 n=1 Tax=Pimephales promelas TaxID=90988 RepID=UPI001955A7A7|nr:uncharacterized protein si:dkey-192k22.2 isoform X2 [Pimephales promelas]